MKVIIAPDKFKGSLSSFEVCNYIHSGLVKASPDIQTFSFPMADGGDGFATILKYYYKTTTILCVTVDPLGREIKSSYEWDSETNTAIIEVASASGLVLLSEKERDPFITSTLGTGRMILDAIGRNAERIILGLGGSATNDAGIGILAALGFQFEDERGVPLLPNGGNLLRIRNIILPDTLPAVKLILACDVTNVLHGPRGAAFVYAKQKGADENAVRQLDDGLKNFMEVIHKKNCKDVAAIPGTGAAGGIAAGLLSFFEVEIKSGIDLVIAASEITTQIEAADLVITGEGKIDNQSIKGKVVAGISAIAATYNKPVIGICGNVDLSPNELKQLALTAIFPIQSTGMSLEKSMFHAGKLIGEKIEEIIPDYL